LKNEKLRFRRLTIHGINARIWLVKFIRVVIPILIAASILGCGADAPAPSPTARGGVAPTPSIAPTLRAPPGRTISPADIGARIAAAAEDQVGVTTIYDPQYAKLAYPNGDVPLERGVCTDVIVRAFRAIGVDLQVRVNEDMRKNFSAYPKDWGLTAPDPNIDHRRVQNLTTYFERMGRRIKAVDADEDFKPGDIVAWRLSGWMQHIGIVALDRVPGTHRYYMIHNIGAGTRKEDMLRSYTILGHYRW
jgi:uncharacterized protein YijF (DUF1287 family)